MVECVHCRTDPSLHSFRIENDTETHTTYYSFISKATDTDVDRIISHIEGFLVYQHLHHPSKTWSWLIDGTDFTIQWHSLDLTYAIFGLMEKYRSTFLGCRIYKSNWWMKEMYNVASLVLSEDLKKILVME